MSNILETGHNMQVAGQMLRACLKRDVATFMWGPPGIGKTALLEQVGADLGWPVVEETLATMDPTDIRGMGHLLDGKLNWAKPDFLDELESYGDRPTILFIDEMNAGVSQALLAASLKLIWKRKAGKHPLPLQCRIVAAGNRLTDRAAVTKTTGPMNNRFSHISIAPDLKAWQTWANENAIEPMLCAYLNWQESRGNPVYGTEDANALAFQTFRSWVQAAKFVDEPEAIRVHLFASQVGPAQAAEFEGFIKLFRALPSIDSILADPASARLPNDIATAFAISSALSRRATRQNFAAVIEYAERVGTAVSREFETVAVLDATKRDETLKETQAYTAWAVRNADVFK